MLEGLRKSYSGFEGVKLAFIIFILTNFVIFFATSVFVSLKEVLSLSVGQPWGVITSVFVHENAGHLISNLEGFVLWTFFFLLMNLYVSVDFRERMSRIFLWTIFSAAFVTNLVELILWGATGKSQMVSLGSSGLVYAALGVVYATALINLPRNFREFSLSIGRLDSKLTRQFLGVKLWKPFIVGAFSVAFVVVVPLKLFLSTEEFFGFAPGIDILGHELGFFFGFTGVLLWLSVASRHPFFILYER